jgi:undecaprenyl-diphosphatase
MKNNIHYFHRKESLDSNRPVVINEPYSKKFNFEKNEKTNLISNKLKFILIIIYYLIIIWSETIYRNYLFEKSFSFEEYFQKNDKFISILKISEIISIFGKELFQIFLFLIIFLSMPLNYSFLMLQSIVYSSYWTNTLKMIYQNERPNWISELLTFSCNYGYGNPSGHSFTSIVVYLCLAHILITYFKVSRNIKIIIFIFFLFLSFLIILSRVILGSHSINQVLYGFSLGLGLYYILIYIIGYHKYTCFVFLKHIKNKRINLFYYIFHLFLLLFTILVYLLTKSQDHYDLEINIFNGIRCTNKNPFNKYKNNGFFQSLGIISLIGEQLGLNLLFIILKNKNYMINTNIVEWNKTKLNKLILRIPIILFSSLGIILYFFIPKNSSLIIIFIFKSCFPFFLCLFGMYFVGIYLCIYLKIVNSEIYKMDTLHELISDT